MLKKKNMKTLNTLKTALCMILFVTFLGCNNNSSQINEIVKELNNQTPLSMGMMGEITQFSISGNYMEMICSVDDNILNLEALKNTPELMHENLVQLITNGNVQGMDYILNELKDANLGWKVTYIGKTSQTKVSTSLSSSEIKQLMAQPHQTKNPKEVLDAQINTTNSQLPMDIGNGMTMDRLVLEENYVVYYYTWDDDMVDLLKGSEKEMKEELVKMLKTDDPTIVFFNKICKDAGVGMAYRYVGKEKGKKVTIYINNDEF